MNWPVLPIGDVAFVQGGIQKQPKRAPHRNAHPFLRVANVTSAGLDLADVHSIELFDGEIDRYRLQRGDLLVVEGNGSASQIGRAAVWDGSIADAVHQNHLIRVRPKNGLDPRFLGLMWNAPGIRKELTEVSSSTSGLHTLSVAKIKRIHVPVPALDVQHRIIGILEDLLSHLDAAQSSLDISLRKIAALRDRTIIRAVTGADLSEHVEPNLAPIGTSDGDLASLPTGWTWARLGEVADVVGGVTKDSKKQSDPSYVEVPYLRVANVQRGRLDLNSIATIRVAPAKAESLLLHPGDVLLNEGGDRDKLARGWVWEGQIDQCIHQNHVFRARVRESRLDPYFLSYTANAIGGKWAEKNGKQSVNLASISMRMIRKMPVIVPAPGDASRIVNELRARLDSYARLSEGVVSAGKRNQALRRALLSAAFSGRLVGDHSDVARAEQLVLV